VTREDTRQRILRASSALFARYGYHGTSTRQIADAVGIRQPSIFYHFPSKAAIASTFLQADLEPAIADATALARGEGTASARLFTYVVEDIDRALSWPYDLGWLYTPEVLSDPALSRWQTRRSALFAAIDEIIRQGIDEGAFVDEPPEFVREVIFGMVQRTLFVYGGNRKSPPEDFSRHVGRFVLRALLKDPERIDEVMFGETEGALP
jgi:AcrR family transcriptional regulator